MDFSEFVSVFAEEWDLTEEEAEAALLATSFEDFAAEAQEMGLSEQEAADLLEVVEGTADYEEELEEEEYEQGDAWEGDDGRTYSDQSEDYGDSYMLDSDWPDDEWLDAGDWYEISAEYSETT